MTDTVANALLRQGQVGPVLAGTPGDVLTFGPDGRTVSGQAIPPPPVVSSARALLVQAGSSFAPIPPGSPGNITSTPFAVPYNLAADEVLEIAVAANIVTASLPAPASSYFNAGMSLEISTDGGATYAPVASLASAYVLLAPPNPLTDAPPRVPMPTLYYQLAPLGAPPTGNQVWFRAGFSSNAASNDSYDATDIAFSFTQAKLIV
jgi:hypothetical protein